MPPVDSRAVMAGGASAPKDRMLKALAGEQPDVVPAAPAYLSLFLADLERAYYIEQYRRRLRNCARCPVDHDEDTLFRARALYQSYGSLKTPPDWLEVHRGASRAWAARTYIAQEGGVLYYEDAPSSRRLPMHEVPIPRGNPDLAAGDASLTDLWDTSDGVRSADDVDARLPITPAEEILGRGDMDLPRLVVADYGERYFISTILDTPFSDAYDLLGFQGLMVVQHDAPALLHHLLARKLRQTEEVMAAWAGAGIHGVYVEEVFTGADTISPQAYDEFVFAYNQPYFARMRELGLAPIHYVCGDVVSRLDRIAALDVAAVAVEESKKNFRIDIEEVVERVAGRAAVFGNIDAVRFGLHATLDEMAAEVRRQVRVAAAAHGFIVSTGSPFPLDTNPRLIDAMVAAAHGLSAGG